MLPVSQLAWRLENGNCLKQGFPCGFYSLLPVALEIISSVSGMYGKAFNIVLGTGQVLHKC